ncbi:MAG: hypothetical protein K2H70_06315, partial [Bacteroidales bacterium]|nr:hypothetical protein [Bacteroidales bacterium]
MKIAMASCSENAWTGDGAVCHLTDAGTDIWIGESLSVLAGKVAELADSDRKVLCCSDSRIWPQVLPLLRERGLMSADGAPTVCFEPGEAHKQIAQVSRGWQALAQAGAD